MTSDSSSPGERFAGQVALVTGGGSEIGAGVTRQLAREGATVHVVDIDAVAAGAVADEVGGTAHGVDVSNMTAVDDLVADVVARHGALDVVVHCAGVDDPQAEAWLQEARDSGDPVDVIGRTSAETWRRVLSVNLDGTFHVLGAAVRAMRPRGRGAIVTIGPSAALDTLLGYPAYAASKAGVHALSQSVAKEAIAHGIRVSVVAPGPDDTPMAGRTPAAVREALAVSGAIGYASPEELADNVCYLASFGAANVVGAVLLSNGGRFTLS